MEEINLNKSSIAKLSSAIFLGITGVAVSTQMNNDSADNNHVAEAATFPSVVYINTGANTSAAPHTSASDFSATNGQNLKNGTAWKVSGATKDQYGNTWYNLGANAWVKAINVSTTPQATVQAPKQNNVQNVINIAKAQLGKPYAWGAKGPSAFDCSGLMYYAFANGAHRNIGGYTVAQESAGQTVSINSLKAGDLVFWGARGATYHVGLYLGNGQYLHAPAPGQGVKIQAISSYFMPSFGVRVL